MPLVGTREIFKKAYEGGPIHSPYINVWAMDAQT